MRSECGPWFAILFQWRQPTLSLGSAVWKSDKKPSLIKKGSPRNQTAKHMVFVGTTDVVVYRIFPALTVVSCGWPWPMTRKYHLRLTWAFSSDYARFFFTLTWGLSLSHEHSPLDISYFCGPTLPNSLLLRSPAGTDVCIRSSTWWSALLVDLEPIVTSCTASLKYREQLNLNKHSCVDLEEKSLSTNKSSRCSCSLIRLVFEVLIVWEIFCWSLQNDKAICGHRHCYAQAQSYDVQHLAQSPVFSFGCTHNRH